MPEILNNIGCEPGSEECGECKFKRKQTIDFKLSYGSVTAWVCDRYDFRLTVSRGDTTFRTPSCLTAESEARELREEVEEAEWQWDHWREKAKRSEVRAKALESALALLAFPHEALLIDAESRKWISPEIWQAVESGIEAARNVLGVTPTPKSVQKRLAIQKAKPELTEEEREELVNMSKYGPADPAVMVCRAALRSCCDKGLVGLNSRNWLDLTPAGRAAIEEGEG